MKSERRHELQTNSLAQALFSPTGLVRVHGSKILLGVIIVLLVALLVNQRYRRNQEQTDTGWTNISMAQNSLMQLEMLSRRISDPIALAHAQKQQVEAISQVVAPMLISDNRQIAAQAYLVQGDLNWRLANLPSIPAAATQPSLQIDGTPESHLALAEKAYEKVTKSFADLNDAATNAKFGLAAVAENRKEFDKAQEIYTQIKSDPQTVGIYKRLAEERWKLLGRIRQPLFIATAAKPVGPLAPPTTLPGGLDLNLTPMPVTPGK